MFEENNNNQNGFDNGFQPLDSNGFNGENQNPKFVQGSGPNDDGAYRYSWTPNGENNDTGSNFHVNPAPKPPKKKGASRAVALVLCCALVGGGAGLGGAALYDRLGGGSSDGTTIYQNTTQGTQVNVQQADGVKEMTLEEIYASYADSCVNVTCQVTVQQGWQQYTGTSSGSGFILSEDGYIVTNYHVIDGANAIKVTLNNGEEYDATLIGGEETNDVAVLKMDGISGLKPVVLGDSDSLVVGQQVSTIGNALGTLSFSQTSGHVSGVGRSVTMSDGTIINMIQTDCVINSGNSGGPLFDQYGRVVGITSAKITGVENDTVIEGLGLVIPINDTIPFLNQMIHTGQSFRPSLGILCQEVQMDDTSGVYVVSTTADTPAHEALLEGDVILAANGVDTPTLYALTRVLNDTGVGNQVELSVLRDGGVLSISITLYDRLT